MGTLRPVARRKKDAQDISPFGLAVALHKSFLDAFLTRGAGRLLRHRPYLIYLSTDFICNTGQWAFRVGTGYLAWDLTHSGFWLGVNALMAALPFFGILPIAGAFADRTNRLNIIRHTRTFGIVLTLALAFLTLMGWIEIYILNAFTFFIAVNQTFTQPVRMTMAPALVPREDLAAAIGVNAGMQSTARFIGPMVGGAMIAALGPASVFILNAFSFSVSLMGLLNITLPPEEQDLSEARGLAADVLAGLRYAFTHASIGPMLILIFVISVLTLPFLELFPGFNDAIFHEGPHGLGMLMSSVGLGGILGSVFVANVGRTKALLSWSFVLMGITCLFDLVFASTDIFWVALVSVAALGFCITCWQSTTTVLIQVSVEGRMRARVMSIYALTFRACSSLGAMIAGAFSHSFGLQKPMIGMALVAFVWLISYLPKRRKLAQDFEAALPKPTPLPEPELERKAAE